MSNPPSSSANIPSNPSTTSSPHGDSSTEGAKCPIDHSSRAAWSNLPAGSFHNPHRPSSQPLSTDREISTIPRGPTEGGVTPRDDSKWVYPSEAQFYSALLRKHHANSSPTSSHGDEADKGRSGIDDGRLGAVEVDKSGAAVTNGNTVQAPKASDMKVVVPIHNAVNEQTWAKILQWEAGRGGDACGGVRLVSFKGDSRKLSPMARWRILLGYQRPFDRHDWVVDRCGVRVRYVIDYYTGRTSTANGNNPFSFYIDARPAMDSVEGIRMRLNALWSGLFSKKDE